MLKSFGLFGGTAVLALIATTPALAQSSSNEDAPTTAAALREVEPILIPGLHGSIVRALDAKHLTDAQWADRSIGK